ncbi:DUF5683 domain-containing protein [Leptospira sp. GIMC2001]|uniref:DUF5683 domain-containing protein n=1 Tax=Leptospira sp. GIMC2001 TaxID=1513297 RepID=UPI00234B35E8|nr:DUF5683 domain-containing protein [Leptospira sp. GIMC2001]WCL50890.1 DUF5683 domain-containing protein [Leptospira sp. GIMC2001]
MKIFIFIFLIFIICNRVFSDENLDSENLAMDEQKTSLESDSNSENKNDSSLESQNTEIEKKSELDLLKENTIKVADPKKEAANESEIAKEILESLKIQNNELLKMNEKIDSLGKKVEDQNSKIQALEAFHKPKEKKEELDSNFRWDVILRSALFPGYGQIYSDRNWMGGLYSSLFVASLINYNQKWNAFRSADKEYKNYNVEFIATTTGRSAYLLTPQIYEKGDRYQEAARASNQAAYIVLGVYLINLLDAFFIGGNSLAASSSLNEFKSQEGFEFTTRNQAMMLGKNGLVENNTIYQLEYSWRF